MIVKVVLLFALITAAFGQNENGTATNGTDDGGIRNLKFPPNFLFGASTSAIQIEGAWNEDGKGESGYDNYVHSNPSVVIDHSTPDIACDSYHLWKEDIGYIPMTGMNAYRFSLSWARLLPTGGPNNVNQIAVDYYNDLINELLSRNITPVVTMYHWDLPLNLTKLGGWTNSVVIDAFVEYATFVLKTFGDRVKYWITLNEPNVECLGGYGYSALSPGMNMQGIATYICGHYKLLAHARVYRLYKLMHDINGGGLMGLALGHNVYYPRNKLNIIDQEAAQLMTEFVFGWIANPVYGSGDYPPVMKAQVALNSKLEGRKISRLPVFTPAEVAFIKGSADFIGVNHYSAQFASYMNVCPDDETSQLISDLHVYLCGVPQYPYSAGKFMQIIPGTMRDSLKYVRENYHNPVVFITENGYPDGPNENLTDNPERQSYFQNALSGVFASLEEGSNIIGYLIWGLLDDMEWSSGYTLKFGVVHVDFNDVNRKRSLKPIGYFFRNVAEYGLNITDTDSDISL